MIQKVFWLKIEDDALHISRQILRSTRNFVASHEIEPAERQRKLICFVQQMKPWLCCSPKRHLILRKQPDTDVFFRSIICICKYINWSHSLFLTVEKQRDWRQLFK